ncbi:NAD(P)H-hydrate epimerase-like [Oscarella lobularis]|uniref:NAD(P)H-hydrate epimerase-like n=1 Tax=Oscarella lobularis TaxID=121494 RepID=UPI0033137AFD
MLPLFSFVLFSYRRRTMSRPWTYVTQREAQKIDEELFSDYQYSVDQLMELAGLGVASAVLKCYPRDDLPSRNVLVCCGPGNNGGDGLVAARHLKLFGYNSSVYYPKRSEKQLFKNLVVQCENFRIDFVNDLPENPDEINRNFDLVIDSLFGFGFKGDARPPFSAALDTLKRVKIPICSVDVPSGWDIEAGDEEGLKPDSLVSIASPKLCARSFRGRYHYLAARSIPPEIKSKYGLNLPQYPGSEQCVKLE